MKRLSLTVSLLAVTLAGCAVGPNPKDPYESFNRKVFAFNEGLDQAVFKPVAKGYETALPQFVRTGVSNFFGNIGDVFIGVNNLLQGKPDKALSDAGRVLLNTTLGIAGLFDPASDIGLEKHDEDFGQTLGKWGVGDGPYLVLPIFGPRTTRDTFGLGLDLTADPVTKLYPVSHRNSAVATRFVSDRAELLPVEKALDEAALDKYGYMRDAYLQRRLSLIYDGDPPRPKEDFLDDLEPAATPAPAAPPTPAPAPSETPKP